MAPRHVRGNVPPLRRARALAAFGRRLLVAVIAVIALAISVNTVSAKVGTPVAVGKVGTKLKGSKHWLKPAEFRRVVERELSLIDLTQVKTSDRFVLEATVTKLETRTTAQRSEATCVVSGLLTRKSGGAVRALLRGRGRAQDAPKNVQGAERAALNAAVKSALSRVEEALH